MRLRDHWQFLAMMVPTLLLLIAVAATLSFPAGNAGQAVAAALPAQPTQAEPPEPANQD